MKTILVLVRKLAKIQEIQQRVSHGTGTPYIWEEVNRISNISNESTEETLTYNLPNTTKKDQLVIGRKFNWSKLYGKLDERRI